MQPDLVYAGRRWVFRRTCFERKPTGLRSGRSTNCKPPMSRPHDLPGPAAMASAPRDCGSVGEEAARVGSPASSRVESVTPGSTARVPHIVGFGSSGRAGACRRDRLQRTEAKVLAEHFA
jgi:hypothetical protein